MTDEMRESLMKAIEKDNRKIRRDKKYAHYVYMYHGIMTEKGNLTKRWKQISKIYGEPKHYRAIRRALGLS